MTFQVHPFIQAVPCGTQQTLASKLRLSKESVRRLDSNKRTHVNGGEPNISRYAGRCANDWPFRDLYY